MKSYWAIVNGFLMSSALQEYSQISLRKFYVVDNNDIWFLKNFLQLKI